MQYKVPKSAHMQVRHSPRFMGLSATTSNLTASQLLKTEKKIFHGTYPLNCAWLEISLV